MKSSWLAAAVLTAVVPASFAAGGFNTDIKSLTKDLKRPVPIKASADLMAKHDKGAEQKEWTVMVYVDGKNNLEAAGLYNVNQMEMVGSTDKVNIVVELGRMKGQDGDDTSDGDWTGARRYYITGDFAPAGSSQEEIQNAYNNAMSKINSPVVEEIPKVDMGDWKHAVDFVKWARKNYPAKKYMLILWDHGSGWGDSQRETKMPRKAKKTSRMIASDDETKNFIGTKQIPMILQEAGNVDVLGYDACLMQMGEVAYEVAPYAKYIVASEELEPGYGQDYTAFVGSLAESPNASALEVSKFWVKAFGDFYNNYYSQIKQSATCSALDTAKLEGFKEKADKLAAAIMATTDMPALKTAKNTALRFGEFGPQDPKRVITTYVDAYDFAKILSEGTKDEGVKAAATDMMDYITGGLVVANVGVGVDEDSSADMTKARGVSLNLARVRNDISVDQVENRIFGNKYMDMTFASTTQWGPLFDWMMANVK